MSWFRGICYRLGIWLTRKSLADVREVELINLQLSDDGIYAPERGVFMGCFCSQCEEATAIVKVIRQSLERYHAVLWDEHGDIGNVDDIADAFDEVCELEECLNDTMRPIEHAQRRMLPPLIQ